MFASCLNRVSPGINDRLVKAAKAVAKTMGHTDYEKSALFHILKTHEEETVAVKAVHVVDVDLSYVFQYTSLLLLLLLVVTLNVITLLAFYLISFAFIQKNCRRYASRETRRNQSENNR